MDSRDESLLEIIAITAISSLTSCTDAILTSVSSEKEHHFNETQQKAHPKLVNSFGLFLIYLILVQCHFTAN